MICLRYSWNITEICLIYTWIYLIYICDIPDIFLRTWDIPKIYYIWDLLCICPTYTCDIPDIYVKYILDLLVIYLIDNWNVPENYQRYTGDIVTHLETYKSKFLFKSVKGLPVSQWVRLLEYRAAASRLRICYDSGGWWWLWLGWVPIDHSV